MPLALPLIRGSPSTIHLRERLGGYQILECFHKHSRIKHALEAHLLLKDLKLRSSNPPDPKQQLMAAAPVWRGSLRLAWSPVTSIGADPCDWEKA